MTYARCDEETLTSNMHHCLFWATAKAKELGKPAFVFTVRPGEHQVCVATIKPPTENGCTDAISDDHPVLSKNHIR